ncbi:hypothetical protein BH10PSE6_BH10PSE6_00380 [soil metagenome]
MSRLPSGKFVDLALAGKVLSHEIDEYVAQWHRTKPNTPLHEYLGMNWDEYAAWVEDPHIISAIIMGRRNGKPFADIAAAMAIEQRLSARSSNLQDVAAAIKRAK